MINHISPEDNIFRMFENNWLLRVVYSQLSILILNQFKWNQPDPKDFETRFLNHELVMVNLK